MRTDYLGRPIAEMTVPDKIVLCVRCLRTYNLATAPRVAPEKLDIREPKCPNCNCKVYYS